MQCAIRNREEPLLRHVAMVAKLLDHNKPWSCKYGRKKMICVNFWGMIAHQEQEQDGSPSASCQSFENENVRQAESRKVVEIQ